jgi:hypothetical protein
VARYWLAARRTRCDQSRACDVVSRRPLGRVSNGTNQLERLQSLSKIYT